MPNSSSRTRLRLDRSPRTVRLALADRPRAGAAAGEATPAVGAPSDVLRRQFDLKELQRRAFERGRAFESERLAAPIAALCERLGRAEAARAAAAEEDRTRVESFAVGLAMAVAERLTRALVAHREHDVRIMAQDLLSRCGVTEEGDEEFQLALDPEDHARLVELGVELPGNVTAVGDPALDAGDLTLRGRHHDTWARLEERLQEVRRELEEEALRADA